MRVAMKLFAEHGIDRVSLKDISDAAGNRNKSAVGYHFASKQGLISALLERIDHDVGSVIGEALSGLDERRQISVSDVVRKVLKPVVDFYIVSPYGRDAFRLLARLMHDPVEGLPIAVRRANAARIRLALSIFRRLQPEKPARLIEQHVHHTIMATINGMSLADRFLALRTDIWGADELGAFFDSYADFLARGLASGAENQNRKGSSDGDAT